MLSTDLYRVLDVDCVACSLPRAAWTISVARSHEIVYFWILTQRPRLDNKSKSDDEINKSLVNLVLVVICELIIDNCLISAKVLLKNRGWLNQDLPQLSSLGSL